MTQSRFIQLSGWGMVVAAVFLLLTFVPVPIAFFVAILFTSLGLLGLWLGYGKAAGRGPRIALKIGIVAGAVGLGSNLWMLMGHENGRPLMNLAMAVMFSGLFLFGLTTVGQKVMPHGNGLPLLAGFGWPLLWLGTAINHQITGQWLTVPGWLSFTWFALMAFFLAWLGYRIQADTPSVYGNSRN